ncbi:MAG: CBS domain-containing protein [Lachnospiraceae bacterium]|nr:CBS domain-containing protein [Lachnospiraceae bacterium]
MNISFYLLPKSEVAYIEKNDNIGHALRYMHKHGYQAIPVIDEEGHYVETMTEGDLLWSLIEDYHMDMESMRKMSVSSIKKKWNYKAVSIDASFAELARLITNQNFVPVVDARKVFIGIVTRKDVITQLIQDEYDAGEEQKEEYKIS